MPSRSLGTIVLSEEMTKLIEGTSRDNNISRESAIKRAFSLLKISQEAKKKGMSIAVLKENNGKIDIVSKITDL